jgi:hypothetical protein
MEEAFADGIEKAMIDMIRRACSTGRSGGPLSTPEQAEHLLDALGADPRVDADHVPGRFSPLGGPRCIRGPIAAARG